MQTSLGKRLELIKDQVDAHDGQRYYFRRTVFLTIFFGAIIFYLLSSLFDPGITVPAGNPDPKNFKFKQEMEEQVGYRVDWLANSPLPGSDLYSEFGSVVLSTFEEPAESQVDPNDIDLWSGISNWFTRLNATVLLQVVFLILISWPFFFIGALGGYLYFKKRMLPTPTDDILGICDRGRGPFYSGIYGPLRMNGSVSATDYSCPGLACPEQSTVAEGERHQLTRILKQYGALNAPNADLVRVILAYRDFPSLVEEERVIEEDTEIAPALGPQAQPVSVSVIRTNDDGTLEQSALQGLESVLSAHRLLSRYFKSSEGKSHGAVEDERHFNDHRARLNRLSDGLTPLAKSLLLSLTPSRGRALVALSAAEVATAYLATEAGKSLVFRREGPAFSQISRFPHLQARAVVQSLLSYHQTYKGDTRLLLRHAILCSRRHGDFGRAFLPVSMNPASRALRDWLEILYAPPRRRTDISDIVELDSQIEELHLNFRRYLLAEMEKESSAKLAAGLAIRPIKSLLWKGLPLKSVVLMPLHELVEVACRSLSSDRMNRIVELMQNTRKLQSSLSISARLPGFKRQAVEAEKSGLESGGVTKQLAEDSAHRDLLERWLIVRRMLTRYNWLSTRIGDDAVPVDGLIQAILVHDGAMVPLSALVPIRQRRFRELFGARWEQLLYSDSPHASAVEVYVETDKFAEAVKLKKEQIDRGQLPSSRSSTRGGS